MARPISSRRIQCACSKFIVSLKSQIALLPARFEPPERAWNARAPVLAIELAHEASIESECLGRSSKSRAVQRCTSIRAESAYPRGTLQHVASLSSQTASAHSQFELLCESLSIRGLYVVLHALSIFVFPCPFPGCHDMPFPNVI